MTAPIRLSLSMIRVLPIVATPPAAMTVHAPVQAHESAEGERRVVLSVDHSELLDYFAGITGSKQKVWLVHGEASRSQIFCKALKEVTDSEVTVGELGKTVEF